MKDLIFGLFLLFGSFGYGFYSYSEIHKHTEEVNFSQSLLTRTDVNLVPYVLNFVMKAEQNGIEVKDLLKPYKIHFQDLSVFGKNLVGLCFYHEKEIGIDPTNWNDPSMTQINKQEALMHELAHCVLGRVHEEALVRGTDTPKSIMFPSLLAQETILSRLSEYDHELFNPREFNKLSLAFRDIGYYNSLSLLGVTIDEVRK